MFHYLFKESDEKTMILETKRLILRKLSQEDYLPLSKILQNEKVMYAYEHAFSDEETQTWLERQLSRYEKDKIGLWAVILKTTGEMIGQCGLTLQETPEKTVVEIGYLFAEEFWHNGFATEAAIACKEYAFNTLNIDEVYSIIRDTNLASQAVAKRNNMKKISEFTKNYYNVDMPHYVYMVKK
ncbi:MAG: GNAT family N-acetyltransferase [Oscillospiraceae bacterium]